MKLSAFLCSYGPLYDRGASTYEVIDAAAAQGFGAVEPFPCADLDTVDQNNDQQLAFDNVVVLFTDIYTYPQYREKDLQFVDYAYGGYGYYIYGGQAERIRWFKGTDLEALRLTELDGETPYEINCGKTYLAVVDLDEYNNFVCEALPTAEG